MKPWGTCTIEQKIERWENCLRVLRSLTPHQRRHHWNMSFFGVKTECGTVACAAGHCGLDPWFRRRGFQMNFNSWGRVDISFSPAFFGNYGSYRIFYNETIRPVSQVIQEVQAHIKLLREKGDPDTPTPDPEIDYHYFQAG